MACSRTFGSSIHRSNFKESIAKPMDTQPGTLSHLPLGRSSQSMYVCNWKTSKLSLLSQRHELTFVWARAALPHQARFGSEALVYAHDATPESHTCRLLDAEDIVYHQPFGPLASSFFHNHPRFLGHACVYFLWFCCFTESWITH